MKKLCLILVLLLLTLTLTASQSFAFTMIDPVTSTPYLGPVKFKFSHFTFGTLYGGGTLFGPGAANGSEDAWGVAKVITINKDDVTSDTVWSSGDGGEELTVMFYGLDDDYVNIPAAGPGEIDTVGIATGAHLDVYLDSALNFTAAGGPGARTGLSTYPTVTDGSLFLSTDFAPGVHANGTLLHELVFTAFPFSGVGSGYLEITGGSNAAMFETNGFVGGADFSVDFDTTVVGAPAGWTTHGEDPVRGTAVPEPTSMFLFGMGMLGLVATRMKRKKAA